MGFGHCSCNNNLDNSALNNKKIFIDIAKVFQEQMRNIKLFSSCSLKGYLIPTESLPIFISLIKKYKILDNINTDPNEIIDLNSAKEFPEFELNKDLEIIDSFSQCKDFIEKNKDKDKGNEFIVVNDDFTNLMRIRNSSNKKVLICFDKEKKFNEIKFNDAQKSENVILQEKSLGFFKCNIIEVSSITFNPNTNFLGSFLLNNTQKNIPRRESIDSCFTFDKLIKEGIINENNFFLKNENISNLSNKINNDVDSKSVPSS